MPITVAELVGAGVPRTLADTLATYFAGGPDYDTAFNEQAASPNITINSRDGQGRVATYTDAGVSYAVTYDSFGPATITGGGRTVTYARDAAGLITGVTTA